MGCIRKWDEGSLLEVPPTASFQSLLPGGAEIGAHIEHMHHQCQDDQVPLLGASFLKAGGPKDRPRMRILDSGPKAQDNEDSRNHGLSDPYAYEVFWAVFLLGPPQDKYLGIPF